MAGKESHLWFGTLWRTPDGFDWVKREAIEPLGAETKKVSGFREKMRMTFNLEEEDSQPTISRAPSDKQAITSTMLEVIKELFAANEELAVRHRFERQAYDGLKLTYNGLNTRLKGLQKRSAETAATLNPRLTNIPDIFDRLISTMGEDVQRIRNEGAEAEK